MEFFINKLNKFSIKVFIRRFKNFNYKQKKLYFKYNISFNILSKICRVEDAFKRN